MSILQLGVSAGQQGCKDTQQCPSSTSKLPREMSQLQFFFFPSFPALRWSFLRKNSSGALDSRGLGQQEGAAKAQDHLVTHRDAVLGGGDHSQESLL